MLFSNFYFIILYRVTSASVIEELIYNIKKNKIQTEDSQKLAEHVFRDKSRVDRGKYIYITSFYLISAVAVVFDFILLSFVFT